MKNQGHSYLAQDIIYQCLCRMVLDSSVFGYKFVLCICYQIYIYIDHVSADALNVQKGSGEACRIFSLEKVGHRLSNAV
jgi:hypothetical protein